MIYVMRHGETDSNKMRMLQGSTNTPLNETGIKQAHEARNKTKDIKFKHIYTSDLDRAFQTGSIVNLDHNLDIIVDERIRENHYGKLEGKIIGEIPKEDWDVVNKYPNKFDSEGYIGLYNRVKEFYDDIKDKQNVLVVTHAGTSRMLLWVSQKDYFDYDEYRKFFFDNLRIGNCEIFQIS